MEHLKGIGTLFYVINPYSTMYENISDIPKPDFMSKVPLSTDLLQNVRQFSKLSYLLGYAIFFCICRGGTYHSQAKRKTWRAN